MINISAVVEMRKQGMKLKDIAAHFNTTRGAISWHLNKNRVHTSFTKVCGRCGKEFTCRRVPTQMCSKKCARIRRARKKGIPSLEDLSKKRVDKFIQIAELKMSGYTAPEIARKLGLTTTAVRNSIMKGRRHPLVRQIYAMVVLSETEGGS